MLPETKLYHYKAVCMIRHWGDSFRRIQWGIRMTSIYAYAHNDPLDKVDRTGMDSGCVYTGGCEQIGNNLAPDYAKNC